LTDTVGIMGCGWLGLALAKDLLKSGYVIKGTTTSITKLKTLKKEEIEGFIIKLNEDGIEGDIQVFLSNLNTLVINIPPGLRKTNAGSYVLKIKLLLKNIQNTSVKNIVFISSTSVYGNIEGEVTEASIPKPETESGKQLLESEKLFLENSAFNTAIIRFGGLIGEGRHPVNYLAGKSGLKNGEELVNLIHRDDCIHMIKTIIEKGYWNMIFNGVYPLHPTKKEYYSAEALKRGLPTPEFITSSIKRSKKVIISRNFLNKLNFLYTSITS
jgi:nucleoside-diphosphate-sugar epimerase